MIVLLLGGARSGKSAAGERLALAAGGGAPYYVATGVATDHDMRRRIDAHRAKRDGRFETIELPDDAATTGDGAPTDLATTIAVLDPTRPMLIDALGTWIARHRDFVVDHHALVAALCARTGTTVVVSDEVGLGVHPETEVGRSFRDRLGELNEAIASVAGEAYLIVAGRALALRDLDELRGDR